MNKENIGTAIVLVILISVIAIAIKSIINDKKKGTCHCGCAGCTSCKCHCTH